MSLCRDLGLQATLPLSVLLLVWALCSTSHLKWELGFLAVICPPSAAYIGKQCCIKANPLQWNNDLPHWEQQWSPLRFHSSTRKVQHITTGEISNSGSRGVIDSPWVSLQQTDSHMQGWAEQMIVGRGSDCNPHLSCWLFHTLHSLSSCTLLHSNPLTYKLDVSRSVCSLSCALWNCPPPPPPPSPLVW